MKRTDVVVVGGGQAGLAMSRCLQARGMEHVVLERGRIAERWRSERWDSLRLLTPPLAVAAPRLLLPRPGSRRVHVDGARWSATSRATRARSRRRSRRASRSLAVERGRRTATGSTTDRGGTGARASVIVATGHCDRPLVPALAAGAARATCVQLVPTRYRNPAHLPAGGVLVVGASATGVQLAEEIHALRPAGDARRRAARPAAAELSRPRHDVVAGRHRLPRRARGRRSATSRPRAASRRSSSSAAPTTARSILGVLRDAGVRLVGRVAGVEGAACASRTTSPRRPRPPSGAWHGSLGESTRTSRGAAQTAVPPAEPLRPIAPPPAPAALDLRRRGDPDGRSGRRGIARSYPWLRVPVLDERGEIRHVGRHHPRARAVRPRAAVPAAAQLELPRRRRRGRRRARAITSRRLARRRAA